MNALSGSASKTECLIEVFAAGMLGAIGVLAGVILYDMPCVSMLRKRKCRGFIRSGIGSIHPDNVGSDHPGQPRKASPLLALQGSDNYFLGPVGKPSGLSIDAIESAIVRETLRSVCSHSDTVALVDAVPVSEGS